MDVSATRAADDIIKFWSEMHSDRPPLIHPQDRTWMLHGRQADKVSLTAPVTPVGWVNEARTSRVQLGLLPVPYIGDLRNADIVICLLNPGLGPGDFYAELQVPEFRVTIASSLRQDFPPDDPFPFLFLDPQWCWTGGYQWWTKKLNGVISKISEHHGCSYIDAAGLLARRIAAVELFPYHSTTFDMHRGLSQLQSCVEAREFVRRCAGDSNKLVIITRQVKAWQVSDEMLGRPDLVRYSDGQERGAHISPSSPGGRAILNKVGVTSC